MRFSVDKEQTSQTSLHQNSDTSIGRCVEDTEDQPKLTVPCPEDESDTSFSSSDRQAPAAEVPGYQQPDRCALQVEMLHHIQRRRQTILLLFVCPESLDHITTLDYCVEWVLKEQEVIFCWRGLVAKILNTAALPMSKDSATRHSHQAQPLGATTK